MMDASKPEITFLICKIAGFSLMILLWLRESEITGFFLLLFLILMSLLRWRFPPLRATVILDCIASILLAAFWGYAQYALILLLFEGMYRRFYWVGFAGIYLFHPVIEFNISFPLLLALGALCGLFLGQWEKELEQKRLLRDAEAGKYYELEHLQSDLMTTLPQIERMTAVAERARIARDIHDNAGHEIVAAYISLQTLRKLLETEDAETLELYDAALQRLSAGVGKIRETAHNLQTVTATGVEALLETCEKFPGCPVEFRTHGDTSPVPIYVWSVLESCLNESLTNVARHTKASYVTVELDATRHLVRLCVANDGVVKSAGTMGTGLRNLRHRVTSIGGSLSVDAGRVFRLICVIPIKEEKDESISS